MNIPYVGLMMLYLIPIGAMLILNSYRDIKDIIKRVKLGDYLVLIEKSAALILFFGLTFSFLYY